MNKFRVGEFLIESELNSITSSEQSIRVEPKVMQVLLCLVAQAGEVVRKEQLIRAVWTDTFVTDDVLTRSIFELRKVFRDQSKEPRYIQTIPRSGYRLIAKIEKEDVLVNPNSRSLSIPELKTDQEKTHKKILIAMALLISTGAIATILLFYWSRQRSTPVGEHAIGSIAVLPFVNANSDPDTDFIAYGITDNLIDRLSHLPNLTVKSHTAVFHYKDRQIDPRTIGSELGVEAFLTGRFVRRNDDLTISLELVNAQDNSHIWGEQYNRKLSDLLGLQREIPLDVSEKLRLKLSGVPKERVVHPYTENAEAYRLYLQGRFAWSKWTPEGTKQATQFFEEAIKRDPNYALAYAGLADAEVSQPGLGQEGAVPPKEARRRARESATKALSLDPQLAEAHAALAKVILLDEWDFSGAEREYKRALELNPNYAEGHHWYSHLLILLGRFDESLAESKRFLELDPISETPIGHLAYHHLSASQYDEAIQQYKKDLQLYPDAAPDTNMQLGNAYHQKRMFQEAVGQYLEGFRRYGYPADKIAELSKAFAKSGIKGFWRKMIEQLKAGPQTGTDKSTIASIYAALGEKDQTFEWLEKAYAEHSDGLLSLKSWGFDSLRSDPRYADLLRRVGLPQ